MEISRIQQINEYLLRNTKTIYLLRKIRDTHTEGKHLCAYVISLAKAYPLSLEAQVGQFYDNCKNLLLPAEALQTEDRCFKITADTFEVIYCLEAWRKNADKTAYIENGQVKVALLHRMSCEQAAGVFRKAGVNPLLLVDSLESLKQYTNPADRYAALAKRKDFSIASSK